MNIIQNSKLGLIRGTVVGILAALLFLSLAVIPAYAQTPQDEEGNLAAGLAGDVFIAPPPSGISALDNASTPGYAQTSEFFIGRVAVGIVLPESDGSLDASTEDWTQAERDLVRNKVQAALEWWADREPNAHLTFVYDDGTQTPVATGYEPITRPQSEQYTWITQVMQHMGYSNDGSYFDQVRDYNNALRQQHNADWAFTLFVVDSSSDDDGRFAGGSNSLFAYAYINGPFAVVTYSSGNYGSSNLDAVIAHEVGHIFGALDQYAAAAQPCNWTSGYLAAENQNSQYGGCLLNEPSIMRGGLSPYWGGSIDPYARAQIGWRDTDRDGILDPLDTPVSLTNVSQAVMSQQSSVFTLNGQVEQVSYPSPTRPSTLINPIQSVQYRVDGGQWVNVQAADGAFDSLTEAFEFTTGPLASDQAWVQLRVVDSFDSQLLVQTLNGEEMAAPQSSHTIFLPFVIN